MSRPTVQERTTYEKHQLQDNLQTIFVVSIYNGLLRANDMKVFASLHEAEKWINEMEYISDTIKIVETSLY